MAVNVLKNPATPDYYCPRLIHFGACCAKLAGHSTLRDSEIPAGREGVWIAIAVAMFTALGAMLATAQGSVAYHDWACKKERPAKMSKGRSSPARR